MDIVTLVELKLIKRLEARPTATHCIDCKTLDEIKENNLVGNSLIN